MTLFGPSGTTSGASNATVSAVPSTTLAFAAASRLAIISLISSIERSICSVVMALMPPLCSTFISRGTSKTNNFRNTAGFDAQTVGNQIRELRQGAKGGGGGVGGGSNKARNSGGTGRER